MTTTPDARNAAAAVPSRPSLGVTPSTDAAPSREEAALLGRLRTGCDSAYRELIERHGPRMLATARRLLHHEEDARDVVQEALLSGFRALPGFDGRSRLATWLHRIVVNAALMKLRSKQSRVHERIDELLPEFARQGPFRAAQRPWGDLPEDPLLQKELQTEVHAAIACLPDAYRIPLLLRDIEGLSNQELARELGISVNAAKIRVHRSHQALRTLLTPRMESLGHADSGAHQAGQGSATPLA